MPDIDPAKVQWKYFSLSEDAGSIHCTNDKPKEKPVLAVLNTSTWFFKRAAVGDGLNPFTMGAPAVMKLLIKRILNPEGRKPNFCIAVPCRPVEEMREFYGPENLGEIEDDYASLYMYDDLRLGKKDFISVSPGLGASGSMPAKEGAEQIASAIENGFDIWAMSGGNNLFPKLQLCEKYFADKPVDAAQKKSRFIGFSDGSTSQFFLRNRINPIHYLGLPLANRKDQTLKNKLFQAIEGSDEDLVVTREFSSSNAPEIQKRYEEMTKEDGAITNLTFFPRQLRVACDSGSLKFKPNEKLILSLEGYSESSTGYNVSEVLANALTSRIIKAEDVIFISIEDVVKKSEESEIVRKNGLIPSLEDMPSNRAKIEELAKIENLSPEDYIEKSNKASSAEYERIRQVAKQFEIPVVEGGERRAGHGGNPLVVPSQVVKLEFAGDRITQTSTLQSAKREVFAVSEVVAKPTTLPHWSSCVPAETFSFYGEEFEYQKPQGEEDKKSASPTQEDIDVELSKVRLKALTNNQLSAAGTAKIVGGNVLNVVEHSVSEIEGKGLFVHLPFKHPDKGTNPFSDAMHVISSDRLKAAKFLILSMSDPAKFNNCTREEYLENRDKVFAKFVADFDINIPVFITTTSTDQSKLSPSFEASLDLDRAVLPATQAKNPVSAGFGVGQGVLGTSL